MKKPRAILLLWIQALILTVLVSLTACIRSNEASDQGKKAVEPTIEVTASVAEVYEELTPIVTPEETAPEQNQVEKSIPAFDQFIQDLKTGEIDKIVGLWVENKLALVVVYQPSNNPAFVSAMDDVATYFLLPYKMAGNYGMLAHNYLAGRYFENINVGDIIQLVFGDGNYEDFEVVNIEEYQALQPHSSQSEFINLLSGEQLTANNVFIEVYMGDFHTTLQTCIAQGRESEWGRLFVLAPPL